MVGSVDPLLSRVARWEHLGKRTFSDGTILIAPMPTRGSAAYLHRLYGPLSQDDISDIEERIGSVLPDEIVEFYKFHNGCSLFSGSIKLFGLVRTYRRSDLEAMERNPIDIVLPALDWRATHPSSSIQIGAYLDGTRMLINNDGSVVRVPQIGPETVLNTWGGFWIWFLSEIDRISHLYGADGAEWADFEQLMPAVSPLVAR